MVCLIEGCNQPIRYKGLCGKHYKRQWRHGDPTKTLINMHEKNELCIVKGCYELARRGKLCKLHYTRKLRYGTTETWKAPAGSGRVIIRQYNRRDRKRATIALGKPLPKGAIIHHHYGDPDTLVILPSQRYHMELHQRQRRLERGLLETDAKGL
jgi:hypothetical protein